MLLTAPFLARGRVSADGAGADLMDVRGLCLADEQRPLDLADAPGADRRDGGVSHDGIGDSGGVRRRGRRRSGFAL